MVNVRCNIMNWFIQIQYYNQNLDVIYISRNVRLLLVIEGRDHVSGGELLPGVPCNVSFGLKKIVQLLMQ